MNNRELACLAEVMETLEISTSFDTGVRRISGGFANAEFNGFDENYAYIKLKWGIQSDVGNQVNTENYKLPRTTLLSAIPTEKKVALLEDSDGNESY